MGYEVPLRTLDCVGEAMRRHGVESLPEVRRAMELDAGGDAGAASAWVLAARALHRAGKHAAALYAMYRFDQLTENAEAASGTLAPRGAGASGE
jgi:hypothetical protein